MKAASLIYPIAWLQANRRKNPVTTDAWYIAFANQLVAPLQASGLFAGKAEDDTRHAALTLALYLHDAVAQNGGWKVFTSRHTSLYNKPLPFYSTTGSDYVADEINRSDVTFVLWTCLALPARQRPDDYTLSDPYAPALQVLADEIYTFMDKAFEEAPIDTTTPSPHWMRGTASLGIPARPLPEQPSNPANVTDANARRCLEYSGGHPLLYFADYDLLSHFFIDVLGWADRPSNLLPNLAREREFVIYANARGMLLAHSVAACFRDPHNPLYNPSRAKADGYRLFCQPGLCPFDLLKLGITAGLLPDAQFPFTNGQKTLQENADFLARYYLGEYYEAD